jgi:hypothetical protein
MVFLLSELTRRQKKKESSGRSPRTAKWRTGILGEMHRIYEPDSAAVPKWLFGRGAQFARDILMIQRAADLDGRKVRISIMAGDQEIRDRRKNACYWPCKAVTARRD